MFREVGGIVRVPYGAKILLTLNSITLVIGSLLNLKKNRHAGLFIELVC